MTSQIPQEIIERIRQECDLVDIVSGYVNLKKYGKNYQGLCPFHNEKTPSFNVSPDKQLYYCFGCGAGGDVFNFIEEIEKLNFVESCEKLANLIGLNFTRDHSNQDISEELKEKESIKKINKYAANFFRYVLLKTETGKKARSYLQERGLNKETIDNFYLGYAPDSWRGLSDFLMKKGFPEELLIKAGLSNQNKQGTNIYDRFRDRIIFPIANQRGEILGFGGRLLKENDKQPKYLNSPETPVFNKRKILYGLNLAFKNIRKEEQAIIVEGYTDVIASYQEGVPIAVASLGTSLTEEQARIIKYNTNKVLIAYDADSAGESATLRGLELLQTMGLHVMVCELPKEYDPDDYIQKFGAEKFKLEIMDQAKPLIEYQLRQAAKNKNLDSIEGKKEYVQEVIPIISKIRSAVERESYLSEISKYIDVSFESLQSEFRDYTRKQQKNSRKMDKNGADRNNKEKTANSKSISKRPKKIKAEEELLSLMLHYPEYISNIKKHLYAEDFNSDTFVFLTHRMYKMADENHEIAITKILDGVRQFPEVERVVTELSMKEFPEIDNVDKFINDCVYKIKETQIKKQKNELQRELSEINPEHEPDKYREVLERLQMYIKMEKTKQWTLEEGG
ncbi:DNA primase [Natranaerobius trueperi]|uniref:DNA primase n=1 Tax=Natranaerobius trueperi TaxID=759412 RepID=A0A226BY80_9FIRM|nr:DNA primase [Natranaerobius trueperi]OWZ83077.1 DNA primase [Natranaerobius trueperi]